MASVVLLPDYRIEILPAGALLTVQPLTELLFNGLFDQGLLGWQAGNDIGFQKAKTSSA
jgi:hypothetical protein